MMKSRTRSGDTGAAMLKSSTRNDAGASMMKSSMM